MDLIEKQILEELGWNFILEEKGKTKQGTKINYETRSVIWNFYQIHEHSSE